MDLVHALTAAGLAARATDRRFLADEREVRAAEQRALARREALVAARPEYTQRGRHAAPRPLSA